MEFDEAFRTGLEALFRWRRDVRRFRADALPSGMVDDLLTAACLAPSVGLSQPWRFVVVDDPGRRQAVLANYETCNRDALAGYSGERALTYAAMKLAGIAEAPAQVTVFADHGTEVGHGLGRRTMPEMIDYSVVTAIHTIWLAARARNVGLGWVSILDPATIAAALDVPGDWRLIGHLCLGYPADEEETPELQRCGWEARRALDLCLIRR